MSEPPPPTSERRRAVLIACGLAFSYLVFAPAVLKSKTDTDPLYHQFTDHIRHRFCAAIAITHPLHALTTPLYLLKEESLSKDPATNFPKDPCTQGGVVHVLFQAPFQWLLDVFDWTPAHATNAHVLVELALGHLWLFFVLRSRERAWTAAFLYPFVIRTALMGVQAPLECLLAYFSFESWMRGRRELALALFVATFASYSRYLIWIPAWGAVAFLWRRELTESLARTLSGWRGKIVVALLALSFAWSVFSTVIVWRVRHVDPADRVWHVLWGGAFAAVWLAHLYRNRRSELAIFCIAFGLFIASYNAFIETWYFAPLMALVPLARNLRERLLWMVSVTFLSDVMLWDMNLWSLRAPLKWAYDFWLSVGR